VSYTRTFVLVSVAALVALAACTEEKKSQTLRPYSGPRDSGAEAGESIVEDAAASDAPLTPLPDSGADTTAPALIETYLSDLTFTEEGGYGPAEKDMSNGDINAADGVMMKISDVPYTKGIGTHSGSKLTWALGGQYKQFVSDVGVDDEVDGAMMGSVVFRVVVDGVELFNSNMMTYNDAAKQVTVDVTGKNSLELFVDDGGDGGAYDHADWAGARLRK
jgi:hypothetical protein